MSAILRRVARLESQSRRANGIDIKPGVSGLLEAARRFEAEPRSTAALTDERAPSAISQLLANALASRSPRTNPLEDTGHSRNNIDFVISPVKEGKKVV